MRLGAAAVFINGDDAGERTAQVGRQFVRFAAVVQVQPAISSWVGTEVVAVQRRMQRPIEEE